IPPEERESLLESCQETRPDLIAEVRELLDLDREPGLLTRECSALELLARRGSPEPDGGGSAAQRPRTFVSRHAARVLFLLANIVALVVYCGSLRLVAKYSNLSIDYGWDADPTRSGWKVAFVDSTGPAQGKLRIGDYVEALDGRSADSV